MTDPLARLLRRFVLQLRLGAGALELPLPQDLERGDLRQVQHVEHIRAARSHRNPGIVAHAEIAHGMRHQRHPQRQRKDETRQFLHNSPYESIPGFGLRWLGYQLPGYTPRPAPRLTVEPLLSDSEPRQ